MLNKAELIRRAGLILEAVNGLSIAELLLVSSEAVHGLAEHDASDRKPSFVEEATSSVEMILERTGHSKIDRDPEIQRFIHRLRGLRTYSQIAEACLEQFGDRAPSRSAVARYILRMKGGKGAGEQHD